MAAKRHARTITETELQELVALNDEAERLNTERITHLIELAALRNVTLDEVCEHWAVTAGMNISLGTTTSANCLA